MKLGIISLGCEKNRIDTELFLGVAKRYGIDITNNIDEANIIVVNTCGFIKPAKQESIDTILEVCDKKNNNVTIIVMGCLVQRYYEDLKKAIPEVDIYIPIKDYNSIDDIFKKITNKNISYKMDYNERVITTKPHQAYLRIAEGCDNRCAYCAIPLIRGNFVSRPFDSLIEEAKILVNNGAKELTLIAQDTTRYGTDFKDKDPRRLEHLLRELSQLDGVELIRVLYLYPDEITDAVLDEIANNPKVAKYFDIPIQHASNKMLKLMNRRGNKELIKERIENIRKKVPHVIVRTTLITGFPGETEEDFNELVDFIKDIKFERLGCFAFSKEEDTQSYNMKPTVPKRIRESRRNKIMKIQKNISLKFNKSLIGNTYNCIIDDYDYDNLAYIGRNYMCAPDDADGKIYIYSPFELQIGQIVNVQIVDCDDYDLYAKLNNINKDGNF